MKVNNIKFSMISNKSLCEHQLKKNEKYIIPFGKVKITVYGHSPLLINVTGCKSMQEVKRCQNCIEIAYNVQCTNLKIDNIFYSYKDFKNIDMSALYYHVREKVKEKFVIDYNVELFPGLYMKTKCKGEPTLILFRTGSYTIMGCKSINQVKEYRMFIINLLNHFVK